MGAHPGIARVGAHPGIARGWAPARYDARGAMPLMVTHACKPLPDMTRTDRHRSP